MILLSSLCLTLGYLPTSKAVLGLPSQSHFPPIPKVNTTNATPQHNVQSDVRKKMPEKEGILILHNLDTLDSVFQTKIRLMFLEILEIYISF